MVFDFLKSNLIANICIAIFVIIAGLVVLTKVVKLITSITNFFNSKRIESDVKSKRMTALSIKNYETMMDIIHDIIDFETINVLEQYVALSSPYPLEHLDEDIKKISDKVFNGLDIRKISQMDLPVNKEYICASIISTAKATLLRNAIALNDQFRL